MRGWPHIVRAAGNNTVQFNFSRIEKERVLLLPVSRTIYCQIIDFFFSREESKFHISTSQAKGYVQIERLGSRDQKLTNQTPMGVANWSGPWIDAIDVVRSASHARRLARFFLPSEIGRAPGPPRVTPPVHATILHNRIAGLAARTPVR